MTDPGGGPSTGELSAPRALPVLFVAIGLVLILGPPLVYLVRLAEFGELPARDYYGVLDQLAPDGRTFDLSPGNLLGIKSNEHNVALPAAIYAANAMATGGDNRMLSVFVLLVVAGTVGLFVPILGQLLGRRGAPGVARVLLIGVVSVFLFNLAQAHNVVLGFSGTMWLLSNALAVAAIAFLAKYRARRRPLFLGVALLAAGAGAVTYSTNLALWPALLVGALLLDLERRDWIALLTATGWAFAFYFALYQRPGAHPELETAPSRVFEFTCAYLGALFETGRWGWVVGLLGVVASAVTWAIRLRDRRSRAAFAPLVMIQVYGLGNAIGTALGRAGGLGIGGAKASRYSSLPALFWLALVLAWAVPALGGRRVRLRRWAAVALVGLGSWVVIHERSVGHYRDLLAIAARQPAAAFAIRHGLFDRELLRPVTTAPSAIARTAGLMRGIGHVPFREPSGLVVGEPAPVGPLLWGGAPAVGGVASFEPIDPENPRVVRVRGWASEGAGRVRRILFTDGAGDLAGAAFPGFPRRGRYPAGGRPMDGILGALRMPERGPVFAWLELRNGSVAPFPVAAVTGRSGTEDPSPPPRRPAPDR